MYTLPPGVKAEPVTFTSALLFVAVIDPAVSAAALDLVASSLVPSADAEHPASSANPAGSS